MATTTTTTSKNPKPVLKLRMRVSVGEVIAIGPGKIALLEALAEQGSITAAAKSLDMSYRRAWLLIDELNRSLVEPAVASATGGQRGGGSELTPAGRRLIELYRGIEAEALKACAADVRKLLKLLR
ncbi:winged helix-turn-helix domain-containing protein [Pelomonas sp. KK5]|uniref:winged helix-turn-helix domain-containing protein n=1 Tax=Pelomonas sp. KK5 TaxID=1855730 RepID=UPI00097CA0A2|nr:LysR family transcriptional regulator [Pelomonas sp. KK5]